MEAAARDIAQLRGYLGDGFDKVVVRRNESFVLDDPDWAYITRAGHYQLSRATRQGRSAEAAGSRRAETEHITTCPSGQLLLGSAPAPGSAAHPLVLCGASGGLLWKLPVTTLLALRETRGAQLLERLFDDWVRLLIGTLPPRPPPVNCLPLGAAGAPVRADRPLRAESGLVWVAPERPLSYLGLGVGSRGEPPRWWPLTEAAWVRCEAEQLRPVTSLELMRQTDSVRFADGFASFATAWLDEGEREAHMRACRDLASRARDRKRVSVALRGLAAVGRGERLAADLDCEAFECACRILYAALGISAARVPKPEGSSSWHMARAVARLSSVRTRRVTLAPGWSEHDHGPLLAFMIESERAVCPVALVRSAGRYTLHDPRDRSVKSLTRELAAQLDEQAYQLYAPLPDRALGLLDVLAFSSAGSSRELVATVLVAALAGALGTALPIATGIIFDHVIPGSHVGLLWQLAPILLCAHLALALFDLSRSYLLLRAQTRMDVRLEAAVWDRLLTLPLHFFRGYSAGDLADRASGIGAIRDVLATATVSVALSSLFSLWNFALLCYIDVRLALVATALVCVAGVVSAFATSHALRHQRHAAELDGKLGGLLLQIFSGITKLRVAGAEDRAFGVWSGLFVRKRDAALGAEGVSTKVAAFQAAFPVLASAALFWALELEGGAGLRTTGQFLAFNAAFVVFMAAVLDLIGTALKVLRVVPKYERAKPILRAAGERQQGGSASIQLQGLIELSHVSFQFEPNGPLILDDINLRIEPQEFVALVGPSGSGKSTLLRLLLGLDACRDGAIFYDGQSLCGLDLPGLRRQIGVVLQNSRVMAGDVFSNIVGSSGSSLEEAWRAVYLAALDADLRAMPMGMHTVLTAGGPSLSGGQRQRLLIARALVSEPRLVFFDEATSSLDNVTQARVNENLGRLGITRLVVAHRLSTIRHADKIVVMERGRIVQCGRYEELMRQPGLFRKLAQRQTL